jgi:hypothetical protein
MKSKDGDIHTDKEAGMEMAKRIMKRLAETPHRPHQPLGVRPKAKERPASKERVRKRP